MNPETFKPNVRPAAFILLLILFASFVPAWIAVRSRLHFMGMVGGWVVAFIATHIWWTIRSRITGPIRWLVPGMTFVVAGVAIAKYPDPNLGLRIILCLVGTTILWCGSTLLAHPLGWRMQRLAVVGAMFASIALTYLVRIDGTSAELFPEVSWRWTPTAEERAAKDREKKASPVEKLPTLSNDDWPQFRGVAQESRLVGAKVRTDWDKTPPKEVWRKRVGPCWGSCIIVGDLLYTQEQRGANEATTCVKVDSGDEVWSYETAGRFEEAMSGIGPRSTPTFADGFIYSYGALGKLVKLDARTGMKIWEIHVPTVTDSKPPTPFWGYASAPFVMNGLVIVFVSGGPDKGTAALKVDDGSLAWLAGHGRHGYSTAHRTTICGVDQLLMTSDIGIEAHDPMTGKILWSYSWFTSANRSTQPVLLGNDELLLTTGYSTGTRRLKIAKSDDRWSVTSIWENRKFRPYYNDAVLHNGLVFGFDDSAFVCLDVANGKEKWRAGTIYGFGQVLLLANQGLLVVQTENGKVALVEANGDEFAPVATFKAFERKSWNHPVIAHGKLFVRNNEELVCYDISQP